MTGWTVQSDAGSPAPQDPSPAPRDPLQSVLADLEVLEDAGLSDQVAVYERLHASLSAALAGTVDQPGPASGGR